MLGHQWRELSICVTFGKLCSYVALQSDDDNSVGWRDEKNPLREASEPYATYELVVAAATWHASTIYLDNTGQQREERCTQVHDAVVDDQNVYRLNNSICSPDDIREVLYFTVVL